ncbi:MAG: hypothetical protein IPL52_08820 [Flavobacteriales bacterium]|nr:hypothetical protein [Flavobacteriales bacterium]
MEVRLQWPEQAWAACTFLGEPASESICFHVLKAIGEDGRGRELKGTITLLR